MCRNPRYYHDPQHYCPQLWLPRDHPLYDRAFENDHLKGMHVFGLGPRICLGREMAWMQAQMFMAKALWTFDIVNVPGQQHFDVEGTLLHYGLFPKPELGARFVAVERGGDE